ncbi:hypothetical protein QBC41DRAFT_314163 [Cercophora samala]|uniref:Uncharacterized protein n=1 Tax=Cercophora samala TaxID=330535 RepID=A0AA40DFG6_9PEZI|nr:hypothetical protein QBC41DRAFT_314163 [Cercophora samala]
MTYLNHWDAHHPPPSSKPSKRVMRWASLLSLCILLAVCMCCVLQSPVDFIFVCFFWLTCVFCFLCIDKQQDRDRPETRHRPTACSFFSLLLPTFSYCAFQFFLVSTPRKIPFAASIFGSVMSVGRYQDEVKLDFSICAWHQREKKKGG